MEHLEKKGKEDAISSFDFSLSRVNEIFFLASPR
jgi:hypothetical protein